MTKGERRRERGVDSGDDQCACTCISVMRCDKQQCRKVTSARMCTCFDGCTLDRRKHRARASTLAGASWRRTGLDPYVHEGCVPRCGVGRLLEEVPVSVVSAQGHSRAR